MGVIHRDAPDPTTYFTILEISPFRNSFTSLASFLFSSRSFSTLSNSFPEGDFKSFESCSNCSSVSLTTFSASPEVTASILLTPAAILLSFEILKRPSVLEQRCEFPHTILSNTRQYLLHALSNHISPKELPYFRPLLRFLIGDLAREHSSIFLNLPVNQQFNLLKFLRCYRFVVAEVKSEPSWFHDRSCLFDVLPSTSWSAQWRRWVAVW